MDRQAGRRTEWDGSQTGGEDQSVDKMKDQTSRYERHVRRYTRELRKPAGTKA